MNMIPTLYPGAVGNSDPDSLTCEVPRFIDVIMSLRSPLANAPLSMSYITPKPLNAVIQQLLREVVTLRNEVATLQGRIVTLEDRIVTLEEKVEVLEDATLPVLPLSLCAIIDAMLYTIGYNPDVEKRAPFITRNLTKLGDASGLETTFESSARHVQSFMSNYTRFDSSTSTTTSLAIAYAISRTPFPRADEVAWQTIFERTFNLTVEEQLKNRGNVCEVDARWPNGPEVRFKWKSRCNR